MGFFSPQETEVNQVTPPVSSNEEGLANILTNIFLQEPGQFENSLNEFLSDVDEIEQIYRELPQAYDKKMYPAVEKYEQELGNLAQKYGQSVGELKNTLNSLGGKYTSAANGFANSMQGIASGYGSNLAKYENRVGELTSRYDTELGEYKAALEGPEQELQEISEMPGVPISFGGSPIMTSGNTQFEVKPLNTMKTLEGIQNSLVDLYSNRFQAGFDTAGALSDMAQNLHSGGVSALGGQASALGKGYNATSDALAKKLAIAETIFGGQMEGLGATEGLVDKGYAAKQDVNQGSFNQLAQLPENLATTANPKQAATFQALMDLYTTLYQSRMGATGAEQKTEGPGMGNAIVSGMAGGLGQGLGASLFG